MDLNWNAVYGFWLVAEHSSYAEAARAQPRGSVQALHKRVKQLEGPGSLNVKLFRSRGVRGVELTDAGRRLHDLLSTVFRSFDNMATDLRGEEEGVLRLGISAYASFNYGQELIAGFHKSFPRVSVLVAMRSSLEIVDMLEAGRLDVGICSPAPVMGSLKLQGRRPLKVEVLAAPSYLAGRSLRTWHEIFLHPVVLFDRTTLIRGSVETVLSRRGLTRSLKVAAEVPTPEMAIDAVRAGYGVSFVPDGPKLRAYSDGLVRLAPPPGFPSCHFGVLYRSDRYLPKYARDFVRLAAETVQV